MKDIPFYMDLQATVYHRNLARSVSNEAAGQRDQQKSIAAVIPPRTNIYSRSISLRNGYTSEPKNGDRHLALNGNHPAAPIVSTSSISQTPIFAMGKDGRQRVIFAQKSLELDTESNPFAGATLTLKETGFLFGCPVQSFVLENEDAVYSQFAKCHKCYDLIPTSTKLVAFDTQLQVKKAFYALVENCVRAAPLWDSGQQQFVGMLTITDFIHILRRYYKTGVVGIKELEEHKIATWRDVLMKDDMLKPFLTMDAKESLYNAVRVLCDGKVHRLPIMDKVSGNILYILTHKKILRFLYGYIRDLPTPMFLHRTPRDLGIGCWDEIVTVNEKTKLFDALSYFLDKRVSALPVIDEDGKVIDIYSKADVLDLAADKSYNNLCMTLKEALKHRSDPSQGLRICNDSDSLATIIKLLFDDKVHRVVIVDDELRVLGMVSLSDVLAFLVLRPQLNGTGMADSVE